jgi:iron-sulfur cluster repair protein YtfE (RIC family)
MSADAVEQIQADDEDEDLGIEKILMRMSSEMKLHRIRSEDLISDLLGRRSEDSHSSKL